ncbi:glucose 1-dehydrogenase [Mycolicibacillus parakoreensis]|uniref:Glucose 1-dehydrogenase n=1 Tax=Mycolicibacillus parakoreensis TaxID=1069221 RepID=A0ABY3U258_9MYCO|nr:glucose 1-dehydrogenase [Mycolicibacillus parakoreensis]MCV7316443.1 glucose 1-dehydrogenase [Mycolicibacillus parakoreensis]ULN52680.1 glucose 1-dehydrogenase [Mycolicibacillus parakoreensis]
MGRVAGKVALISGGGRGMGAAHARALIAEGARVVIGDVVEDEGAKLVEQLGEQFGDRVDDTGAPALFTRLDVTRPDDWRAAVALAVQTFGKLDVLVNNAGIANINTLAQFDLAAWQKILDVNLTGTFLGMQAAVEPMTAAGGGSIINISSVEGMRGSPGLYGYVASKFAVRGLAKAAAVELAAHNIRVNTVLPGLVRTRMAMAIPDDSLQIPLGRAAKSPEVAACVLYLASDESSYSTGADFVVDGGLTAGIPHKNP